MKNKVDYAQKKRDMKEMTLVMNSFKRTSYWTVVGQLEATGFRLTKRRPGMYFLYQVEGNKFITSIKEYLDIGAFEEALTVIRGIVRYN